MQKSTPKIILLDAQAIIDLHSWTLWKRLTHNCEVGVSSIIRQESRFYKNAQGHKLPIDLQPDIEASKVLQIEVASEKMKALVKKLNPAFLPALDEGELEAIAFLFGLEPKDPYYFCTADGLAIKCLGALGLRNRSLSLEELFKQLRITYFLPPKYSKAFFDKMLQEGFRDGHLYLRRE